MPYKPTVPTYRTIQYRTVPGEYPHQNIQGIEDLGALLPAPRSSIPCYFLLWKQWLDSLFNSCRLSSLSLYASDADASRMAAAGDEDTLQRIGVPESFRCPISGEVMTGWLAAKWSTSLLSS